MAVEAVPVELLPLVPAVEGVVLADDDLVLCQVAGLPDLAVEPYECELAVVFVSDFAVSRREDAYERAVPDKTGSREALGMEVYLHGVS